MAVPWLRIFDTLLGLSDLTRRRPSAHEEPPMMPGSHALGHLETRLAGVVVAALKEAFDRDSRRLELEREQVEAERRRHERALRLELLRQAGDREIGRLRLVAGIAVAASIGALLFVARVASAPVGARFALAVGWLLLLGSIAASFGGQSQIGR